MDDFRPEIHKDDAILRLLQHSLSLGYLVSNRYIKQHWSNKGVKSFCKRRSPGENLEMNSLIDKEKDLVDSLRMI